MSHGSLEGAVAKIYRAAEHYGVLKALNGGVDYALRPVHAERDDDGLTYRFYIGPIETIPDDFALILGDAFHNLRSALDHLVFELHVRHFRGNVPDYEREHSMFPIYDTVPKRSNKVWDFNTWNSIKSLGQRERTKIEFMQPYHRWSPKTKRPWMPRVWQYRHTLSEVSWFDIVDKHRTLHVIQATNHALSVPTFPDFYGFRGSGNFRAPLEDGAHVATWTFRIAPPPEEMQVHGGVVIGPAVEKSPGVAISVLQNLAGCITGVGMILEEFAPLFPTPSRSFFVPNVSVKMG